MPPFGPDKSFNSLYAPKEPTLSGSNPTKARGGSSSRDAGVYSLSNPFIKKPASQQSSPVIFGLGTSLKSNVGADLTLDSSKNKTIIGQNVGTNQNIVEQVSKSAEQNPNSIQNINPDVTKSATAAEKVVEDVIKKINKAEAAYNYIPSSFEAFLLQNSKNKVLFNFIRPTFSYNLNIVSPTDQSMTPQFSGQNTTFEMSNSGLDENPNLIPLDQTKIKQIDISNFSLLFYKTKNKPSSIEEMTSESNLYKELTPAKKELSVVDFLDVNTDYYFYVIPEQNLIDKISSLIVTEFDLSLGDFKVTTAGEKGILSDYVYRIKVIKDGELYFLEKEAINLKEIKDTKKTKSFFGTILIEPVFQVLNNEVKNFYKNNAKLPFIAGDSIFDSKQNYPYIKLRFKSKKSNRKFDLNLNYVLSNVEATKITEQEKIRSEFINTIEAYLPGKKQESGQVSLFKCQDMYSCFQELLKLYVLKPVVYRELDFWFNINNLLTDFATSYELLDSELIKIYNFGSGYQEFSYNKFSPYINLNFWDQRNEIKKQIESALDIFKQKITGNNTEEKYIYYVNRLLNEFGPNTEYSDKIEKILSNSSILNKEGTFDVLEDFRKEEISRLKALKDSLPEIKSYVFNTQLFQNGVNNFAEPILNYIDGITNKLQAIIDYNMDNKDYEESKKRFEQMKQIVNNMKSGPLGYNVVNYYKFLALEYSNKAEDIDSLIEKENVVI